MSLDKSDFAEMAENASSQSDITELQRILGRLSMKNIMPWDPEDENGKSISSHLKSFENAKQCVSWTGLKSLQRASESAWRR